MHAQTKAWFAHQLAPGLHVPNEHILKRCAHTTGYMQHGPECDIALAQQVELLHLLHLAIMLLLCAQAVAQLFSSLQACLFSLGSAPASSLYVNLLAVDHLLQAGVLTFQSAQPLLQILHQPCKLSICRTSETVCLPGIRQGFCATALLHDKAQRHTSLCHADGHSHGHSWNQSKAAQASKEQTAGHVLLFSSHVVWFEQWTSTKRTY